MRINITARHFKLNDDLKVYTENEVQQLTKYFDNIIDLDVILEWQKFHRTAELKTSVFGTMLTAQYQADEMHKAIHGAVDKMERQLIKYKEKLRNFDHEKTTPQPVEAGEDEMEDFLEE